MESSETYIPHKVREAFKDAKDFGEFRSRRVFTFLHVFSGGDDMISKALIELADREGLMVRTSSVDTEIHGDLNMLKDQPYETIIQNAKDHEYDAAHCGFPCGSFSRARLNVGKGPPPVRSLEHIYGFPFNNRAQQGEADKGTVLAVRATSIVKEVLNSQRKRRVPQAGTLENPPGSETKVEGPAWELPEIKDFLKAFAASTALYNTCAFMTKEKVKWFKPGRFSGCLEGLPKLARKCKCPSYVTHESLVGKEKTARAAKYPEELATEVAKLIVDAWKLTLQLEFWRLMLESKKEEVTSLQAKWLESKEKKQIGEEGKAKILNASKRIWTHGDEEMSRRPGMHQPSKKARREAENEAYIGGMRNPGMSVAKLPRLRAAGKDVARLWDRFIVEHPHALQVAKDYGAADCALDQDVLKEWKAKLAELLKAKDFLDVKMRDAWEFVSPLDAKLWDAWIKFSGDPEPSLVSWIRGGAPLGMEVDVEESGIFPLTDLEKDEIEASEEINTQLNLDNYKSFVEAPDQAKIEIDRLVDLGFCMRLSSQEVQDHFETGTISRLALIVKCKEDGSLKRRVIIDLLRSGGNRRCRVPERIVLPRAVDVVSSARFLWDHRKELMEQAAAEKWDMEGHNIEDLPMEIWTADLADAYCHFPVDRREFCHCLTPGVEPGEHLLFRAMLFGFRAAPLIMGRLSSCIARMIQSLTNPWESQTQLYMDDPLVMLQGPESRRLRTMALILYMCGSFGVRLSFKKGLRGSSIVWIGIRFEICLAKRAMFLTVPKKVMEEITEVLRSWEGQGMIPLRELRSVTGRLSWIAGILPRTRWCTSIMYAVIADCLRQQKAEMTTTAKALSRRRDDRPKHNLVHVKRVELPRQWFLRVFHELDSITMRKEPFEQQRATLGLITDASPRGLGAILFEIDQETGALVALDAIESPITEDDAKWLGIPFDDPAGQGPLEGLAILAGLKKWNAQVEGQSVIIKSDSVVALAMAEKGAAKSPVLNWIGAELSIRAERCRLGKLIGQHIPGAWNVEADWLSRPHQRGAKPARLEGVPIKKISAKHLRRCYVDPPGVKPELWGNSTEMVSQAFESL